MGKDVLQEANKLVLIDFDLSNNFFQSLLNTVCHRHLDKNDDDDKSVVALNKSKNLLEKCRLSLACDVCEFLI